MSREDRRGRAGIGMLMLFVVVLFALLLPPLLDNRIPPVREDVAEGDVPSPVEQDPTPPVATAGQVDIGGLIVSTGISPHGCPVDSVSLLTEPLEFYVVAPQSTVPQGTEITAEIHRDDGLVQESEEIITAEDYLDWCVGFHFETVNSRSFPAGDYVAELYVNNALVQTLEFSIQ